MPKPHSDMSPERHVTSSDTTSLQAEVSLGTGPRGTLACISLRDGRCVALDRPVHVGRADSCELAFEDAAMSREHAVLTPSADGHVTVTDLGSRNGTFVDGRRVSSIDVASAVVRIGEQVFRIAVLADEFELATAAGPLVGGSSLAPVRRTLGLVAPTELPVLVLGETGTGKDVAARGLHVASRREGAFVAVNCAALPDALVESELFGHARGSFTGAATSRRGLVTEANGGTLFLDEIGELPLAVQAKLLRVLEDRIVRPVGSEQEHRVDVRVVSATNRDLHARARTAAFRADLLARIAGVEIRLPPLRDRVEDLPALIRYLWQRAHARDVMITPNALEALALDPWLHNIRELDHALRAAALADLTTLAIEALPERLQARLRDARAQGLPASAGKQDQRLAIETALREQRGNLRRVAQLTGIARGHLYRLMKRWDLDPANYRNPSGTDRA